MRESGIGREGGIEGLEPYLKTKYVSVGLHDLAAPNKGENQRYA